MCVSTFFQYIIQLSRTSSGYVIVQYSSISSVHVLHLYYSYFYTSVLYTLNPLLHAAVIVTLVDWLIHLTRGYPWSWLNNVSHA